MSAERAVLGDNVMPLRYVLRFEPGIGNFVYRGIESIYVRISKRARRIRLNAVGLDIRAATVVSRGKEQKARVIRDVKTERITLLCNNAVGGNAEIRLEFEGRNGDSLYGFYRSKYSAGKGSGYLLTTQLEAANARNAFPCFDEPALKATFDVSMLVDESLECISNMPVKSTEHMGPKKLVTFYTTPKMSTYLLYLGVGRYERLSGKYRGIRVSVLTTPGKKALASVPLEYAMSFLKFYERYFGIMFPLPKIDLLAIPDFAAGAMENWGAITFREADLLCDEKAAVAVKQRIAEVVAHELAHQWFGDLVTMKWWNDLWLNESFATFMSFKAMDNVFPSWNMKAQYLDDTIGIAFSADQLKSTHPISVEVHEPGEIDQIFDEISYEKGGTILNMLEDYAGSSAFRSGLRAYLSSYAYSNAVQLDLWKAIGKAAERDGNKTFVDVAKCWINKAGYPLVSVRPDGDALLMSQERFYLGDARRRDSEKWLIPLHLARLSTRRRESKFLMRKANEKLESIGNTTLKLNYGQSGLYRVMYPQEHLEAIGNTIKNAELGTVDAWGVENDLFAFAIGRRAGIDDYLDFVEKYCFAAGYPLNVGVLAHLRYLFNLFYDSGERFRHVRHLLGMYSSDVIKQIGWMRSDSESNTTTMARSSAVFASGLSGDRTTLSRVHRFFMLYMSGKAQLDSNLRSAVYNLAALNYSEEAYPLLRKRYEGEGIPEERMRLLAALGMLGSKGLVSEALEYSLSGHVRLQDSYVIPAVASSNPIGRDLIWGWTRRKWKGLMNRYGSGTHILGRYVSNMSYAHDYAMLSEVKAFFSKRENFRKDIGQSLAKTLERIKINADFMKFSSIAEERE